MLGCRPDFLYCFHLANHETVVKIIIQTIFKLTLMHFHVADSHSYFSVYSLAVDYNLDGRSLLQYFIFCFCYCAQIIVVLQ